MELLCNVRSLRWGITAFLYRHHYIHHLWLHCKVASLLNTNIFMTLSFYCTVFWECLSPSLETFLLWKVQEAQCSINVKGWPWLLLTHCWLIWNRPLWAKRNSTLIYHSLKNQHSWKKRFGMSPLIWSPQIVILGWAISPRENGSSKQKWFIPKVTPPTPTYYIHVHLYSSFLP